RGMQTYKVNVCRRSAIHGTRSHRRREDAVPTNQPEDVGAVSQGVATAQGKGQRYLRYANRSDDADGSALRANPPGISEYTRTAPGPSQPPPGCDRAQRRAVTTRVLFRTH